MNLNEHQSKKLLREVGVNVPLGQIANSEEEAGVLLNKVDGPPWVVKAQITAGGRANGHFLNDPASRGGVRFAETEQAVRAHAKQMLGGILVTNQTGRDGDRVNSVYIEQKCSVQHELYFSISVDRALGCVTLMAARDGGSHIEEVAQRDADAILQIALDIGKAGEEIPATMLTDQQLDELHSFYQLPAQLRAEFAAMVRTLCFLFVERDASLVEINPFGVDVNGQLVALDASIAWDDNALFRQGHEEQLQAYADLPLAEHEALTHGLNYVRLDGNIGTLAAGAGLALVTVDAVTECGGHAANFLDIPPSASVERIETAISILLREAAVDVVLINVFGGGIMRCDAICDGLLLACRNFPEHGKPIVVRLVGINSELALQRLQSSLPEVQIASDLGDAAAKAVAQAQQLAEKAIPDKKGWLKKARNLLPEKAT